MFLVIHSEFLIWNYAITNIEIIKTVILEKQEIINPQFRF